MQNFREAGLSPFLNAHSIMGFNYRYANVKTIRNDYLRAIKETQDQRAFFQKKESRLDLYSNLSFPVGFASSFIPYFLFPANLSTPSGFFGALARMSLPAIAIILSTLWVTIPKSREAFKNKIRNIYRGKLLEAECFALGTQAPTVDQLSQAKQEQRQRLLATREKRLAALPEEIKAKIAAGEPLTDKEKETRFKVSQEFYQNERDGVCQRNAYCQSSVKTEHPVVRKAIVDRAYDIFSAYNVALSLLSGNGFLPQQPGPYTSIEPKLPPSVKQLEKVEPDQWQQMGAKEKWARLYQVSRSIRSLYRTPYSKAAPSLIGPSYS